MLLLKASKLESFINDMNIQIENTIPEINSGGCGVFASLMYKELVKLGYQPKIIILDRWSNFEIKKLTLNNVNNGLRTRKFDRENTSFSHCVLQVGSLFFDGIDKSDCFSNIYLAPKVGEYTIEELDLALKFGSWNDRYNRKKKNPTLKAIIKKEINKYKLVC